eukprot:gnl/TRDRNA2_/TRDRNA2_174485_c1_seq7.p1 gnl/TRDRNA2_/TRDRNA2_174485_c1~~gnl/TRDRNA2_/TRDRNA2_174485_c1_seq7.p1  ORF type:complete len:777 (+),score=144.59 gnl/TRDRNA2_/TRDRNA2_174485_c1_seq7:79-2409(+)
MTVVSIIASLVLATTSTLASAGEGIVLDDAQATHYNSTKWQQGSFDVCTGGAHSASFHHDAAGNKGFVKTEFIFNPPKNGCYLVEEWHPSTDDACSKLLPTEVRLDVDYCRGLSTYTYVDYSVGGGQWNQLGRLPFFVGLPGKFTSANNGTATNCAAGAGCLWVADAFRLTLDETLDEHCMPLDSSNTQDEKSAASASPSAVKANTHSSSGVLEDLKIAEEVLAGLSNHSRMVIDDSDAAIDNTAWQPYDCDKSGWKERSLLSSAVPTGSQGDHALFTFQPPVDGCYLVEEFHPASTCDRKMTSRAKLSVHYCMGEVQDVVIDQATRGNRWNFVALLPFYKDWTAGVTVSRQGIEGEFVAADAFRFTRVAEGRCEKAPVQLQQYQRMIKNAPISVTLDDRAAMKSRSKPSSQCDATALLGSAHTVSEGEASAEYAFEPPSSGCYRVDEFHPKKTESCNLGGSAHLRVDYCDGKNWQGQIGLAKDGARWNTLGHFPFFAGMPGKVTSRRLAEMPAGTHWVADAFRLTKVADSCFEVPHAALVALRIVGAEIRAPTLASGLTTHVDLRHALHTAVAKAAGISDELVRLLGARRGSIIAEFELLGPSAEDVSFAVQNIEKALAGPVLPEELCAATRAGSGCKVELAHKAMITPPPSRGAFSFLQDQTATLAVIAAIGAVCFLLLTTLAGIGALCRRRRQKALLEQRQVEKKQQPDIETAEAAEVSKVPEKKTESDEKESVGSGSTKTPENTPSEEGGNSAKDDADIGSQQSPAETTQQA